MERGEICQLLIRRVEITFSPSEEELQRVIERLEKYDQNELEHFEKNFLRYGIDEIVKCIFQCDLNA